MSGDADHADGENPPVPIVPTGSARVTDEEELWNGRLTVHLEARRKRLEEARAPVPGSVSYGASNFPHDPTIWSPDWRDGLPPGDPLRKKDPPITESGTPRAYKKMAAAYKAIISAYGLAPDENEEPAQ